MWWIDFCLSSSGPTALSNLAPSKSFRGFQDGTSGKEPTCQWWRHKRCGFEPWVRKIPWRRKRQPTPVFLSGESHGQNSLVGYSLWDRRVGHDWSNLTHTKALDLSYDTLPITLLILATWPLLPLTEKHVQRISSPKVSFILQILIKKSTACHKFFYALWFTSEQNKHHWPYGNCFLVGW